MTLEQRIENLENSVSQLQGVIVRLQDCEIDRLKKEMEINEDNN